MYKRTADFLAYMERSNGFVDRILAGGNRLATDVVDRETDPDILVAARAVIARATFEARERFAAAHDRRSDIRRDSCGRPRPQLAPDFAKRIDVAEQQFNRATTELNWCEFYLKAIDARLLALSPAGSNAYLYEQIEALGHLVGKLKKKIETLECRVEKMESVW